MKNHMPISPQTRNVPDDPTLQAVLNGVAKITAEIKQRLDDDVPEISETLLQQLAPQLLRPFPSATIMQFNPKQNTMPPMYQITKGTEIFPDAKLENAATIRFKTTSDLEVHALEITDISQMPRLDGCRDIKIFFRADPKLARSQTPIGSIKFYIDAGPEVAFDIFELLSAKTQQFSFGFSSQPQRALISLGDNCLSLPFLTHNLLLPLDEKTLPHLQTLISYFCFPEHFLFLTINIPETILWSDVGEAFFLLIKVKDESKHSIQIQKSFLKLHCVSAINLMQLQCEPVFWKTHQQDYPLCIDADNPGAYQLYSVDEVESLDVVTGLRKTYGAQSVNPKKTKPSFNLDRQNRLTLGDNNHRQHPITVSCKVTVCNADLPHHQLRAQQLNTTHKLLDEFVTAKNVSRPSPCIPICAANESHWNLISFLNSCIATLDSIEKLKNVLNLLNVGKNTLITQLINSLVALQMEPFQTIAKGVFLQGIRYAIIIDDRVFPSSGVIYCFACALQQFLSALIDISMMFAFSITNLNGKVLYAKDNACQQ